MGGISIENLNGNTQLITLNESVDPDTFIRKIKESIGDDILYIQPDYQMELSGGETASMQIIPLNIASETVESNDEETVIGENASEEIIEEELIYENITVAVIDTGIDTAHPDFEGRITQGYDFVHDTEEVYNENLGMEQAHGTHVAGIIAQTAPNALIMPLKCFENGMAYTSDIIEAISFAKENGALVVSCSWGGKENNQALKEAMEESGLFFVCAAGNNRSDIDETPIYPAAFGLENSVSVASLNNDKGFSYFSNYGISIDIAACGRGVESCFPGGGYGVMNGTSMSAGFVSGAAAVALILGEDNPKERIVETADMYIILH